MRRPRRPVVTRPARAALGLAILLTLLAAAVLTAAAWWMSGGRWLTIESPSMGQAAPVGTLVLTRPVAVRDLAPGDVISFTPPRVSRTYTHRVSEILPGGALRTQGDVNRTPDSWTLHQGDLTGRVVARWWGVGWILKALPLLTVILALVLLGTARFVSAWWRKPARLFLVPLAFAVCGLIYRPWVGLMLIDQTATTAGGVGRVVSTGILPVKAFALHAGDADTVHLVAGQVGQLPLVGGDSRGRIFVDGAIDLYGWWWVAIIVVCLLPIVYELVTMRADRGDGHGRHEGSDEDEYDTLESMGLA